MLRTKWRTLIRRLYALPYTSDAGLFTPLVYSANDAEPHEYSDTDQRLVEFAISVRHRHPSLTFGTDEAVLIGVDWGTSSFRARLLDSSGRTVAQQSSDCGILTLQAGEHPSYLRTITDNWQQHSDLPILLSGMITSRNGWHETPYLTAPASVADFASALSELKLESGHVQNLHFVTGMSCETDAGYPDVLRGEECEVLGHIAATGARNGQYVLPGTHSKWIQVANQAIASFNSCMTGEMFALLKQHSILGKTMTDTGFERTAFERGVHAARAATNLLNSLFSTRTLALFNRLDENQSADYLSGLLIGYEILHSRSQTDSSTITIIGRDDLCQRYELAMQSFGLDCTSAEANMVGRGHIEIARMAGLIK